MIGVGGGESNTCHCHAAEDHPIQHFQLVNGQLDGLVGAVVSRTRHDFTDEKLDVIVDILHQVHMPIVAKLPVTDNGRGDVVQVGGLLDGNNLLLTDLAAFLRWFIHRCVLENRWQWNGINLDHSWFGWLG